VSDVEVHISVVKFVESSTAEREFGTVPADNASLQLMRGFADSDGHIVGSGATSDHETNYSDGVSSGHRRKVVIDGIFNRCFLDYIHSTFTMLFPTTCVNQRC